MNIALWAVAAYALGSVSFAVVVSRAFSLPDPRTFGSGNPGATNVLRTGNKVAAATTLAGDALKGFVAVWAARAFGGEGLGDLGVAAVAVAVFLGHLFPVFFAFKGGKGVATAVGILFALDWHVGLAATAVWVSVFAATKISSLSALCAAAAAPVIAWVALGRSWQAGAVVLVAALVLLRHKANIANLVNGTEQRSKVR